MRAFALAFVALALSSLGCAASVAGTGGTGGGGSGGDGGAGGAAGGSGGNTGGDVGPCVGAAECASLADACNVGTCVNGACEKQAANEGAPCDDGKSCTVSDSCQDGACTSGNLKFCPSTDNCHVGFCNPDTDACEQVAGNDGAPCQDDDACTQTGTCANGACSPGAPVDCSFLDGTCAVGVCDPQLGCFAMQQNDGAPCDDGLYCTVSDTCSAGACSGVPNTCAAPGDVCMIGVCNEAQDTCVASPGNDGAACDDGNGCTAGETCAAGSCIGGVPANQGGPCDDGDACTSGTSCAGGVCGSPTGVIVACLDGDQCCPAGCVVAGDADCSMTRWTDGTMAWPDQACNPNFSFGTCDTNAQDHADAWAAFVCQGNGFASGVWTGNKQAGCSGDISMYCGGQIPCQPLWEFSCADFDQTKIELTCYP